MARIDLDKSILNALTTNHIIFQVCIMFFQKVIMHQRKQWLKVYRNLLLNHAKYSEKPEMHVNQYLTHYMPPLSLTTGNKPLCNHSLMKTQSTNLRVHEVWI